jgi:hypothetical protein
MEVTSGCVEESFPCGVGSHLAKTSRACSETPAQELETLGKDALTVNNACTLVFHCRVYSSTSLSSDIEGLHFASL